jgi:hypothetical protein
MGHEVEKNYMHIAQIPEPYSNSDSDSDSTKKLELQGIRGKVYLNLHPRKKRKRHKWSL